MVSRKGRERNISRLHRLELDGFTCKSIYTPYVYFSADNNIYKQSMSGRSVEEVVVKIKDKNSRYVLLFFVVVVADAVLAAASAVARAAAYCLRI